MNGCTLTLIGGGARSGKSRFALAQALEFEEPRIFVATAEGFDGEMEERIARHRSERGTSFDTIEAPLGLPEALEGLHAPRVVVVDCLTLWLSNLLLRGDDEDGIAARVEDLVAVLRRRSFHAFVVTNEVGMGIVPESRLGRVFRDVAGRAHQRLADEADAVYFAVMGMMLRLEPGPVETVPTPRKI